MKFRYLKVDAESNTLYNCHAAAPNPVDFVWLSQNSGQLFNTVTNVRERGMMLRNERNTSCEQNCWLAEDNQAVSPRMYQNGTAKTHTDTVTTPDMIEFTSTSDCNLTCSYCTKEYSSAWRQDILRNGAYQIDNFENSRYQLLARDTLLSKVSQPQLKQSTRYQQLVSETVKIADSNTHLIITGGEPLLDINLEKNLDLFQHVRTIEIFTGLGVSHARFRKVLDAVSKRPNVTFTVSAESVGSNFEFNRYGNTWHEFVSKIEYLQQHAVAFKFNCTLTNLTLLSWFDFVEHFCQVPYVYQFVYHPNFLAPYVLDNHTKDRIRDRLRQMSHVLVPDLDKQRILQSITADPDPRVVTNLRQFLQQFVERRTNISTEIYGNQFAQWLAQIDFG